MSNPVEVTVDGERYDVTNFDHPGEGIRDVYLKNFNKKDVTEELDYYHNINEPYEILIKAKKLGEFQGIKYLGEAPGKQAKNLELLKKTNKP